MTPADGGECRRQLVSRRYERGSMLVTSNRAVSEWGTVLGGSVVATAILDRLLQLQGSVGILAGVVGHEGNHGKTAPLTRIKMSLFHMMLTRT